MALADAESAGQLVHRAVVEGAIGDQSQRARDRRRRSQPGGGSGRRLRPAAQARPVAGLLSGRRTAQKQAVLAFRGASRANRPAIHPGRPHRSEEAAVEARVPGSQRAITSLRVELHSSTYSALADLDWPFSDLFTRRSNSPVSGAPVRLGRRASAAASRAVPGALPGSAGAAPSRGAGAPRAPRASRGPG